MGQEGGDAEHCHDSSGSPACCRFVLYRSNGQESGCQIVAADLMRARRILRTSAELQYLVRRDHDDAYLAQNFDPDTIPQSAHDDCAWDNRWPGKTMARKHCDHEAPRTAPCYLARKTLHRERTLHGLAHQHLVHPGGTVHRNSSQGGANSRIVHVTEQATSHWEASAAFTRFDTLGEEQPMLRRHAAAVGNR
jgi:hypothetical protein